MATSPYLTRVRCPRQDKLAFRWTIFLRFRLRLSRKFVRGFVEIEQHPVIVMDVKEDRLRRFFRRRKRRRYGQCLKFSHEIRRSAHTVKMTFPPVAAYVYSPVYPAPPTLGKDEP